MSPDYNKKVIRQNTLSHSPYKNMMNRVMFLSAAAMVSLLLDSSPSATVAAVPLAWGAGFLGWTDVVLAVVFYYVSCLGVTVGFHRYFTHGAFKAKRPLRIALAIAPTAWLLSTQTPHRTLGGPSAQLSERRAGSVV